MKLIRLLSIVLVITVLFSDSAWSQEESNWEFNLTPLYLWAFRIDGDIGVRERTTSVSIDAGEIFDNIEGAFTVRFNGLYRRKFGFVFDYNYLNLGAEKVSDMFNTEFGFKSQIVNLAGSYRFIDGDHLLDGLAGIRYTYLDTEVNLRNIGAQLDGDQDWVDPIVGLRYNYGFADKWFLQLYGDIGGFGVSSDFTWQGLALIDFQPWKYVSIIAGYRAIGTDYETGSGPDNFLYDVIIHGPVVGFNIRW